MGIAKIVIVENEPSASRSYVTALTALGHVCHCIGSTESALDYLDQEEVALLLIEPSICKDGLKAFLAEISRRSPTTQIIAVAVSASMSTAIDAMRHGCSDYLVKPISHQDLRTAVTKAFSRRSSDVARPAAPKNSRTARPSEPLNIVGDSPRILAAYAQAKKYAASRAPVLITGESGTGKEVCASLVHTNSDRSDQPFVAINCAALPSDLMESELFGHAKGAFTGAHADRQGAVLSANGGTLFLDEIGEMDIALQAKLLRFLQTGEMRKVGSDKVIQSDVRIVCATNRNLADEIAEGRFREDLFYRLNVLNINMPALRERGADAILLADHFLAQYCAEEGRAYNGMTGSARQALVEYNWPGNVRELQNVMRRAVVMHDGGLFDACAILSTELTTDSRHPLRVDGAIPHSKDAELKRILLNVMQPLSDIEREIIEAVVERCGGSLPKAATVLGLSPSTLYRKRENWLSPERTSAGGNVFNLAI